MDPEKSKTEYKCNTITDVIGEEGNNAEMEDEVKDFEEDKGRRKEVLEKGKKRNIGERKSVCLLEKEGRQHHGLWLFPEETIFPKQASAFLTLNNDKEELYIGIIKTFVPNNTNVHILN